MRSLLAANDLSYFQKRINITDSLFEENRHGAVGRLSGESFNTVSVDWDLGGLVFIEELIKRAVGMRRLVIFNLSGHLMVSTVENLCRDCSFELIIFETAADFLNALKSKAA
jgi:hypothetical protein